MMAVISIMFFFIHSKLFAIQLSDWFEIFTKQEQQRKAIAPAQAPAPGPASRPRAGLGSRPRLPDSSRLPTS